MLYTRPCMQRDTWKLWTAAAVSAGLLELPFPLAGPMPPWRCVFAWFGLVPLLWALLADSNTARPRFLRRGFLLGYLCGFLWYCGNCYWVRDTMMRYGDMPTGAPTLLLIGFSLVLGLYFGLFGLAVAGLKRTTGSTGIALTIAPIFWVALELAASRITSVPWDQLGYSQVDNAVVNQLAPWAGVYGISFVLVCVNAILALGLLAQGASRKLRWGVAGLALLFAGAAGLLLAPPPAEPMAVAVLVQPNLDVGSADSWPDAEWDRQINHFKRLGQMTCSPYIAGIPETGMPTRVGDCVSNSAVATANADLVVWPESPAPFAEGDPRFLEAMRSVAQAAQAPLVVGSIGMDFSPEDRTWHDFNSAMVIGADGARVGRYDKIHLVPFGEYVPYSNLLFFARKLTGRVSSFTRGSERKVFRLNGRRYGVFICYEAVFADEVRQFVRLGAQVLVNVSDDGWYGDTSAPWQHLNMARMRAIENRRWLLRDTNNGVTAAIDPYGRVRQSIPRHQAGVLAARFGFRDDVTFYTEHGDAFAWLCAILATCIGVWALRTGLKAKIQPKARF
ncbi:MAG: apolipoprotein N-acyltransferase [Terracidiphilus sp.]